MYMNFITAQQNTDLPFYFLLSQYFLFSYRKENNIYMFSQNNSWSSQRHSTEDKISLSDNFLQHWLFTHMLWQPYRTDTARQGNSPEQSFTTASFIQGKWLAQCEQIQTWFHLRRHLLYTVIPCFLCYSAARIFLTFCRKSEASCSLSSHLLPRFTLVFCKFLGFSMTLLWFKCSKKL